MKTRQKPRKVLTVPGRYFTGLGSPVDVTLKDLSEGGCRFPTGGRNLSLGSSLQIYILSAGPYHASVRWADKGEVGITFASPLDGDTIAQLQNTHVPDTSAEAMPGDFAVMPDKPPQRFC